MMPLWASGHWLVDAGMRFLSRSDQVIWLQWSEEMKSSSLSREQIPIPPSVAIVAVNALQALLASLLIDIKEGNGSEDDEFDNLNDIDATNAAILGLQGDVHQNYMYGIHQN
jgi:hypothetical protein